MTRKSHSRMQRDAQAGKIGRMKPKAVERLLARAQQERLVQKRGKGWEQLQSLYDDAKMALVQHVGLVKLLERQHLWPFFPNPQEDSERVRGFKRDMLRLDQELKDIHKLHADKKGETNDPDDMHKFAQVFELYHLFVERAQATLLPIAAEILEAVTQAEIRYNAAVQKALAEHQASVQAQAQDAASTDPIDVPFKEVSVAPVATAH